jgi:hypothetical protein
MVVLHTAWLAPLATRPVAPHPGTPSLHARSYASSGKVWQRKVLQDLQDTTQ